MMSEPSEIMRHLAPLRYVDAYPVNSKFTTRLESEWRNQALDAVLAPDVFAIDALSGKTIFNRSGLSMGCGVCWPSEWQFDQLELPDHDKYTLRESDFGWFYNQINVYNTDAVGLMQPYENGVDKSYGGLAGYLVDMNRQAVETAEACFGEGFHDNEKKGGQDGCSY